MDKNKQIIKRAKEHIELECEGWCDTHALCLVCLDGGTEGREIIVELLKIIKEMGANK